MGGEVPVSCLFLTVKLLSTEITRISPPFSSVCSWFGHTMGGSHSNCGAHTSVVVVVFAHTWLWDRDHTHSVCEWHWGPNSRTHACERQAPQLFQKVQQFDSSQAHFGRSMIEQSGPKSRWENLKSEEALWLSGFEGFDMSAGKPGEGRSEPTGPAAGLAQKAHVRWGIFKGRQQILSLGNHLELPFHQSCLERMNFSWLQTRDKGETVCTPRTLGL